ncbi:MAG: hypothetical protein ACK2UW_11310 [Anaerolineales bacterium]
MLQQYSGLIWFLVLIVPLFFTQRRLHFETQAVLLLITRRGDIASALFAVLFFPGVLLHETSHFVTARLLGVKTVNFSLIPSSQPDGRLRLGYVETAKTDLFRDAAIGAAPMFAGGVFVAYAGLQMLGLGSFLDIVRQNNPVFVLDEFFALTRQPDFWLWFYLTIAVSSTMLPSNSDRRAWPPLIAIMLAALGIGLVAGAGPWLMDNLGPYVIQGFRVATIVMGVSLFLQLIFLVPVWGLRLTISKLTKLRVE